MLKKQYNKHKKKFTSVITFTNIFDAGEVKNSLIKNLLIKNLDCPDIFINCSYPISADWKLSSFKKTKYLQ